MGTTDETMQVQAAIAALYGSDAAESARANTFLMDFTEQPVNVSDLAVPALISSLVFFSSARVIFSLCTCTGRCAPCLRCVLLFEPCNVQEVEMLHCFYGGVGGAGSALPLPAKLDNKPALPHPSLPSLLAFIRGTAPHGEPKDSRLRGCMVVGSRFPSHLWWVDTCWQVGATNALTSRSSFVVGQNRKSAHKIAIPPPLLNQQRGALRARKVSSCRQTQIIRQTGTGRVVAELGDGQ